MDKILLFIPAYNCQKQITRVLDQLTPDILKFISEIIVVNNISTDDTEQKVLAYKKEHTDLPLHLLRNQENYGLGGSHKVAFQYALKNGFSHIIILHGDDQGNILDFLPILQDGTYRQYDCCLGARVMKESTLKGYSSFRTFGNRVYNFLFSVVTHQKIYDLGAGLNLYSTAMLKEPFYLQFPDNLMFNYCMILAACFYHHNCRFIPISWREDDQISNVKMVNQALKVLEILWKFFLNRQKLIHAELREIPREQYWAEEISER